MDLSGGMPRERGWAVTRRPPAGGGSNVLEPIGANINEIFIYI